MMNPQQRPTIQDLVRTAMEKSAARIAVMEEAERLRTGEEPSKTASAEADDSIATDYAEKLAAAVEFLLPEVQVKEATGVADTVGNAVRRVGSRVAEKGLDIGRNKGMHHVGKAMTAVGEGVAGASNKQLAAGALGGTALIGGGVAAKKALTSDSEKKAGVVDAIKGVARGAAQRGKNLVAKRDTVPTKEQFQSAKTMVGGGGKIPGKDDRSMPAALKSNAQKVKDAVSSGKDKAMGAARAFKDAVKGDKLKDARQAKDHAESLKGFSNYKKEMGRVLSKEKMKTYGARAAVGAGAVGAAGAAGVAGKKVYDRAQGRQEKKAFLMGAAWGGLAGAGHGETARGAIGGGAGDAIGSIVGSGVGRLAGVPGLGAAAGRLGGGLLGYHLAMKGHRKEDKQKARGDESAKLQAEIDALKQQQQMSQKQAEDAINPAHIRTPKASPLAAAPVRTESSQPGPSPQGNTGALSSNASAIAFSNRSNQAAKAEALRKYFSNPASDQHGDPALTKNFAHKTASASVEQARNILAALAAQVEGK